MRNQIGPFKLYKNKPCDIQTGFLYTMDVKLPVPFCKKRTVRVYLPEGINFKKKYPVIYMLDGQNIVDKYTTAYGAWDIDVREKELIEEGLTPFIVVGIDCPKVGIIYRVREYSLNVEINHRYPEGQRNLPAYSDDLINYVINELRPLINKTFPVREEREWTGVGGSSMGGLGSFNFVSKHPEVFGFALSFSPAFHIYEKKALDKYIEELNISPENGYRFYFYTGDVEFEHEFFRPTIDMYNYLRKRGFDHNQVSLLVDASQGHCEAAWNLHFKDGIRFWLKDYEIN